MQLDYSPFIDRVIDKYEGGYGWNRKDPGGPTKYGITCYDLAEHLHQKMTNMSLWAPKVQAMDLVTAEAIYQDKYATGVSFSILPAGVDCCVLDYAVNSGVARALAVTRAILRSTTAKIDTAAVDAIHKYGSEKFITVMDEERLQFMRSIKGGALWAEFGHGWQLRVTDLTAYSLHLAKGSGTAPVAPDLGKIVTPKATHVAKTAGPITAGGVVTVPSALHLSNYSHTVVALAAIGILALGVGYEAWQAAKTAHANAKVVLPAGA